MSTFLQLVRIGFWMLPLQRGLTVIGTAVALAGLSFNLSLGGIGTALPVAFLGMALVLLVPLLGGGVFLRMLSSSRALLLRPHARRRLLAGTIGILLLATLAWILAYWVVCLRVPVQFRPDLEQYAMMYVLALSFGTQCAISLFIASRSPAWTLVVLVLWQLPGVLLHGLGVTDATRLLGGPVSLATAVAAWVAFGLWYLRVRRIHASGWSRREETATGNARPMALPATREQAMTRWVMGGGTPVGLGLQCLLAALGVLAIQWVFARDTGIRSLQAIMFGTLSVTAAVAGAVSQAMAARARGLWLPAGRSRVELHAWMERQMLCAVLTIGLAVALASALVWWWLTPRPSLPALYLLCAILAPGLAAAWLGLMQQHRRGIFDALAALAIVAGWFHGLVRPLYMGTSDARWELLAAQLALAVLLREVAYVRWRGADWRRVQRG